MEVLTGKEKVLKVFGSDYNTKDGTCVRDYIHVNDLSNAHLKALEYILVAKKTILSIKFSYWSWAYSFGSYKKS